MYGRNVGNLSLYLQYADRTQKLLWRRQGNQGKRWNRALINIPSTLFTLHLEGGGSQLEERYIAIDDLRLANCELFGMNK